MIPNKMINKEVKLIYNSKYVRDRESLAALTSLSDHIINDVDIKKSAMTPRQIIALADNLKIEVKDLIDTKAETFSEQMTNLSTQDLAQTIHKDMNLLKTPIIEKEDATFFYEPGDGNPMDLETSSGTAKKEN